MTIKASGRLLVIGGGHGARTTVQAAIRSGFETSAILSVADDGGSSGVLTAAYGIPAVGDLRTTFAASLGQGVLLGEFLEYRFSNGPLAGHPVGNVMLAALTEVTGSLANAVEVMRELIPQGATVLPAANSKVTLCARDREGKSVRGQLAVSRTRDLDLCWVEPADYVRTPGLKELIEAADYVVLGPGSLYTSVIATLVTGGIAESICRARAKVIYVHNLAPQRGEAEGLSLADCVAALCRHGVMPDVALVDTSFSGACEEANLPCRVEALAGAHSRHDVALLGKALAKIVADGATQG